MTSSWTITARTPHARKDLEDYLDAFKRATLEVFDKDLRAIHLSSEVKWEELFEPAYGQLPVDHFYTEEFKLTIAVDPDPSARDRARKAYRDRATNSDPDSATGCSPRCE